MQSSSHRWGLYREHRHPNTPIKSTASNRKYIQPNSTLGKPKITAAATSERHRHCVQAMPAKQKLSSQAQALPLPPPPPPTTAAPNLRLTARHHPALHSCHIRNTQREAAHCSSRYLTGSFRLQQGIQILAMILAEVSISFSSSLSLLYPRSPRLVFDTPFLRDQEVRNKGSCS